jgi:hypothetical protein
MTVLAQDFTCRSVTSELISVGDLILNDNGNIYNNWKVLESRIQNQSATPGVTNFNGSFSCPIVFTNVIGVRSTSSVNFQGTVTVGGAVQAPTASCTMLANATAQFIGLRMLAASSTTGAVSMIYGRDVTTNNSATFQWDISNTRANISLTGNTTNQIQISSTAVNFTNRCSNPSGDPYKAIQTLATVSFSLTAGQATSTILIPSTGGTTLSIQQIKQIVVTIRNVTYTVAGLPLSLQLGLQGFFNAPYGEGITEGNGNVTIWASNSGAYIHDLITANTPVTTVMRLSWAGQAATNSYWSVQQFASGFGNTQYSVGGGYLIAPDLGNNTQIGIRLQNTTGTCTGTISVSFV